MKIRNNSSIPLTARLLAGVVLLNLVIYSIAAFSLYKRAEKYASATITATQNHSPSISSIISAIPDKADVLLMAILFTLFSSMMVWRVHRKLTEELQAADAVRLSEERFRELVENAPIGVYRRDISGEYHYINPAMLRAFHCESEEEFKARYGSVSQRWAHPGKNIEYNELLRKEGKVTNYEVESRLDDGTLICTLLSSILDESGRIIDGWALDITRKKQSDEELERYRKHLEELVSRRTAQLEGALEGAKSADKAKSQFLANMSHEIRTPMNAVMGMTHLALQGELSPGQRGYLKKVLSAAESLMVIINDILDISKIEAGKLEIELADFRTEELVERVTTITAVKAVEKGLDFRVFLDPAIPPVLIGDPLRIAQVLINLCGNAVKFTESGLVKLKIEMLQRMDEEKLLLRFSVEDTGIGITEEQISRLFSPFSQADATTSRRFGGTGLGLAICKQLVEIMGGEIEVSSTPGKGSDFSFCLPLEAGKADIIPVHDIAADTYEFRQLHNNPHLLLVEDNEFNQQVATELLKQSGCRVTLADNGIDALEKLHKSAFDGVLLDLQMPHMDGFEVVRRIRSEAVFEKLPVIAMTAHALATDKKRCLDSGMSDYISKPINPCDLNRLLCHWFGEAPSSTAYSAIQTDTAPATPEPSPEVDTKVGLAYFHGNEALYMEMLRYFGEHYTGIAAEIQQHLVKGEHDDALRLAHSMKSVAGSLGAEILKGAADELEKALHASPPNTALPVAQFDQELQRVVRWIENACGN